MKKIAVLFAVAALATLAGCPSNSAQACLKSAECAEEEDPTAFCQKADDDCVADDACTKIRDACSAEQDALAACLVANGTCDEVEGTDPVVKVFGLKAFSADGACVDAAEAATTCATDNA